MSSQYEHVKSPNMKAKEAIFTIDWLNVVLDKSAGNNERKLQWPFGVTGQASSRNVFFYYRRPPRNGNGAFPVTLCPVRALGDVSWAVLGKLLSATPTFAVQPQHVDGHVDSLAQRVHRRRFVRSSTCGGTVSELSCARRRGSSPLGGEHHRAMAALVGQLGAHASARSDSAGNAEESQART